MYTTLTDGSKIYYQEFIPTDKISDDVLVLLHDGLGCTDKFREFPSLLADALSLRVISYDRRGYGRSSAFDFSYNKNYMHEEALEVLPELLEKLNINSPLLFGHSDGGSIALIYAGEFSANMVFALAPHVYVEEITVNGVKKEVEIFEKGILKRALRKYHGDNLENVFKGWWSNWLSEEFRDWNITEYLKKIEHPCFIMQGSEDEYATIEQLNYICNNIKVSQCKLLKNLDHMPLDKNADIILESTKEFYENKKPQV